MPLKILKCSNYCLLIKWQGYWLLFFLLVSVVVKLEELVCVFKQLSPYNYMLITWLQQSMKNILIWWFGTRWGSDNRGIMDIIDKTAIEEWGKQVQRLSSPTALFMYICIHVFVCVLCVCVCVCVYDIWGYMLNHRDVAKSQPLVCRKTWNEWWWKLIF